LSEFAGSPARASAPPSMSLQFIIGDQKHIRTFSAAVASLARVGKTLTLEWRDDELILRALTDSQNAFVAFHFKASFFESVTEPSSLPAADARAVTKTKFSARVLAAATGRPRGVARLQAYFARSDAEHVFVLRAELRTGLARTHTLTFEDAQILQPLFRREQAPFQLAARPKMIHDVLRGLYGTDEMSILATSAVVQFQSFHEAPIGDAAPVAAARGAVHSAHAFAVSEFDGAQLHHAAAEDRIVIPAGGAGEPLVAVTFNVKELKVRGAARARARPRVFRKAPPH